MGVGKFNMATPTSAWAYFALVGSNLLFVLPTVRALQQNASMRAFLYATTVFASGMYHLCKPEDGLCLLSYEMHFFLDFLFSLTTLMANLLFLAPFGNSGGNDSSTVMSDAVHVKGEKEDMEKTMPVATMVFVRDARNGRGQYRSYDRTPVPTVVHPTARIPGLSYWWRTQTLDTWLIAINMLVIGVALGITGPGIDPPFWFVATLAALNVLVVFFTWFFLWVYYRIPPSFDWRDFSIALVLAGSGISLFVFMERMPSYEVFHSIWHVLAALGSFYLLESRCTWHTGLYQFGVGNSEHPSNAVTATIITPTPTIAIIKGGEEETAATTHRLSLHEPYSRPHTFY